MTVRSEPAFGAEPGIAKKSRESSPRWCPGRRRRRLSKDEQHLRSKPDGESPVTALTSARVVSFVPNPLVGSLSALRSWLRRVRAQRRIKPLIEGLFPGRPRYDTLAATGDVVVARVRPTKRPPIIVKLAQTEPAACQLRQEAAALEELGEVVVDLDQGPPLATVCRRGIHELGAWFTQSHLGGQPTPRTGLSTGDIVAHAARTLAPLYRATSSQHEVGEATLCRLVDKPLNAIRGWRPDKHAEIEITRQALHTRLANSELVLCRIHGDLAPANLLWSRDRHAEITGVVDWTYSPALLPQEIDLVHLAVSSLTDRRGQEYGQVVAQILRSDPDAIGFAAVDIALDAGSSQLGRHNAVLLSWLHHVAFGLEKQLQLRRNPIWLQNNVDLVLDTVAALSTSPDPPAVGR